MRGVVKLRIKSYIFTVIMKRHYTGAEKKGDGQLGKSITYPPCIVLRTVS